MRNFYLNAQVDGRIHNIKAGPRSKTGGMVVRFYAKDNGFSKELVTINAYPALDKLCINVYLNGSEEPTIFILNRKEENEKDTTL